MKNLAGYKPIEHLDKILRSELTRCGIVAREHIEESGGEVNTHVYGDLSGFTFTRAWTYWMVTGPLPLDVAVTLYDNPVGRDDIRVNGHCGCPSPIGQATWRDPATGKTYCKLDQKTECERYIAAGGVMSDIGRKVLDEHLFHDDPASLGAVGTIDCYHVDSELGLYILAQAIHSLPKR